jgi:PEP-CTERM motif
LVRRAFCVRFIHNPLHLISGLPARGLIGADPRLNQVSRQPAAEAGVKKGFNMRYAASLRCRMAAAFIALVFSPVAKADTITEFFSVTILPAVTLSGGEDRFAVTPFAQFDPADGALNSVTTTLAGSATWTSAFDPPGLTAVLTYPGSDSSFLPPQELSLPGAITIDLPGGTDFFAPDFATLIGTGTATLDFLLVGSAGDTFATSASGLEGSITYDFTASALVPEPSTWAMLVLGFGGLGLLARKRRAIT